MLVGVNVESKMRFNLRGDCYSIDGIPCGTAIRNPETVIPTLTINRF
jgi:hypothetical protein